MNYLFLKASNEEAELLVKAMSSPSCVTLFEGLYQDNFKITAFPSRFKSTVQVDCQISPIPEQICFSILSLRFHYLLPFSIWSDELSKHIFADQKTPSQCSMDRFSK